jgi:transposase
MVSGKGGKEHNVMATTQQTGSVSGSAPAPDPEVAERARTRTFSPRYKLEILNRYESLNKAGKGALLRREGRYRSLISGWRKRRDQGALEALSPPRGRPPADPQEREVERLRREHQHLHTELEKARKVMRVQGELSALLEELASESAEATSGPTR